MSRNTIITVIVVALVAAIIAVVLDHAAGKLFAVENTDTSALAAIDTSASRAGTHPSYAYSTRRPMLALATDVAPASTARFTIPSGTTFSAKILTHISSRDAKVGDRVEAVTTEPIRTADQVIIPEGTLVTGYVSAVRPAAETRSAADLDVVFTNIGGHPTRIALVSPDLAARAAAANRAVDVALVAGGALAGGVIGHQIDHKRGSTVGAISGALVGAAAAANIGANVQLKAGEPATLRFEQSLAIY